MHLLQTLVTLNLLALAVSKPTVYLIRHGEKPDSGNSLSTQGLQRAQCLRSVFRASSSYNIGHIMAQSVKSGEYCLLPPNFKPSLSYPRWFSPTPIRHRETTCRWSGFHRGHFLWPWRPEMRWKGGQKLHRTRKHFDLLGAPGFAWHREEFGRQECPQLSRC